MNKELLQCAEENMQVKYERKRKNIKGKKNTRKMENNKNQKNTPHVAAAIADQWIAWYDDVDNKMFMCLADVDITVTCASGF